MAQTFKPIKQFYTCLEPFDSGACARLLIVLPASSEANLLGEMKPNSPCTTLFLF